MQTRFVRLTHIISHLHLHIGLLEGSHITGNLFWFHDLVHFTHCLRCGCHRTANCDISTHRLILEANAGDFTIRRISTIFLFSQLNQLFCKQSACILVALFSVFLYLSFLTIRKKVKKKKTNELRIKRKKHVLKINSPSSFSNLQFSFLPLPIFVFPVQFLGQLFSAIGHCPFVALS